MEQKTRENLSDKASLPTVGLVWQIACIFAGVLCQPSLNFTIQIDNPGSYTVWAWGMASDAGGDSLHVGVNGGTPSTAANLTDFTPNQWSWSRLTMSNTNATLDLSNGGTYTLNVSMREDGMRLDKLMLVTDTVTIPTGQGPLESPTTTVLPNLASHTIQYGYDPLYRLTSASYTGDITATYSYVYDAVGNMSAYTETVGVDTSTVNRVFDDANQLLVATDTVSGTTSFYYDGNGNLVQILPPGINPGEAGEQLYSFNQRNLLTQYQVGAGGSVYNTLAEYSYDGGSNRLQQIDSSGTTPITTTYSNDNAGLSQVLVSNDGTTTTYNLFGLDLIQQDDGSEMRTLLVDGLGSARVEMAGNTVETTTTFEPYGKLLTQTGSSGTTYGYTGEQYDAATSLVYLRARYYSPETRMFISRDPWKGDIRRPVTMNGWNYANGNPINFMDPSGLQATNCYAWPDYLNFKQLCEIASENVDNSNMRESILDAREQMYRTLAVGGMVSPVLGSRLQGSPAGRSWAGQMLAHFLDGNGVPVSISGGHMMANGAIFGGDPGMEYFITDPGIRRGIDRFSPPQIQGDEPDIVIPLLHSFIGIYLSDALCTGVTSVAIEGGGSNRYIINTPRTIYQGKPLGAELRPYDMGFWAAFGHVTVNAEYYASLEAGSIGYRSEYTARYTIQDTYKWFEGKITPLPLPGTSETPDIPHEWALSLIDYGRADTFNFEISWTEDGILDILPDFSGYRK